MQLSAFVQCLLSAGTLGSHHLSLPMRLPKLTHRVATFQTPHMQRCEKRSRLPYTISSSWDYRLSVSKSSRRCLSTSVAEPPSLSSCWTKEQLDKSAARNEEAQVKAVDRKRDPRYNTIKGFNDKHRPTAAALRVMKVRNLLRQKRTRDVMLETEKELVQMPKSTDPDFVKGAFSALAYSYFHKSDYDAALRILVTLRSRFDVPSDRPLLGKLARAYLKAGNLWQAEECLQQLRKIGDQPEVKLFNSLWNAFLRARSIKGALGFVARAQRDQIHLEDSTYLSLILLMKNNTDQDYVERLEAILNNESVSIGAQVWKEVAKQYAARGEFAKCLAVLPRVDSEYTSWKEEQLHRVNDPELAHAVIVGHCKLGKLAEAKSLLFERLLSGETPDECFLSLARAYGDAGQLEDMEDILAAMEDWGGAGRANQAKQIVRSAAYSKAGEFRHPTAQLAEMWRNHQHLGTPPPSTDVYNALIVNYCDAGQLDDALRLVKEMKKMKVRRDFSTFKPLFTAITMLTDENERNAKRSTLWEQMSDITPTLESSPQYWETLLQIYCKAKDRHSANQVVTRTTAKEQLLTLASLRDYVALMAEHGRNLDHIIADKNAQYQLGSPRRLVHFLRMLLPYALKSNRFHLALDSLALWKKSRQSIRDDAILRTIETFCANPKNLGTSAMFVKYVEAVWGGQRLPSTIYHALWSAITPHFENTQRELSTAALLSHHMDRQPMPLLLRAEHYHKLSILYRKAGDWGAVAMTLEAKEKAGHPLSDSDYKWFLTARLENGQYDQFLACLRSPISHQILFDRPVVSSWLRLLKRDERQKSRLSSEELEANVAAQDLLRRYRHKLKVIERSSAQNIALNDVKTSGVQDQMRISPLRNRAMTFRISLLNR